MSPSDLRLARLRARTDDAVGELDDLAGLHRHEPAAAAAMCAVRLTRQTLESFWIPALDHDLAIGQPVEDAEYDDV